ncbi:MAG: TIGR04551 family protein [Myxococcota bacterium]|nr:TIGR04551 family protein [Myxococcota bacterium]
MTSTSRSAIWSWLTAIALLAAAPLPAAAQEKASDTQGATTDTTDGEDAEPKASADDEASTADSDFQLDLSALGGEDPAQQLKNDATMGTDETSAQAVESWTERELELLELHGYFRVRPELYHSFNIRNDGAVYPLPANVLSRQDENYPTSDLGLDCREKGSNNKRKGCSSRTTAGANLRLRLEPTLNVSEDIRIKAQIDFLDNVMMGSTPRYYQNFGAISPSTIEAGRLQGWDMGPPNANQAIVVRRAWGEVMTPIGQLRFGRMGDHFGLGMVHNSGNGVNDDFGDTVDRLMFAAKLNDWLIAPAFDFPSEGVSAVDSSGRPFDFEQLDDAWQLAAIIAYKHDAELQQAMLRRGDWVVNTGLYFTYRWQVLSYELEAAADPDAAVVDTQPSFYRRDMWAITPDLWFQFLYKTFHLELELALSYGQVGNPDRNLADFNQAQELTLLQYGGVLQADFGLLSDQLRIGLEVGLASGDKGVEGLRAPASYDQLNDPGNKTFSAFSFNPAYNTDIILYHHILGSISQTYYFHPWLRYDFFKGTLGKRLALQADVIFSRAMFFKSTINDRSANLGLELNASAMYMSADGFHAGLQYGVLFPLRAFEGLPYDSAELEENPYTAERKLDIPQTIQVLLGISF